MVITVTRQDIEAGRRCDPDCCPVARAISRAGIDHFGVVGASVMVVDGRQRAASLPLPSEVKNWILDFDGSRPVEPISFELCLTANSRPRRKTAARPVRRAAAAIVRDTFRTRCEEPLAA